MRLTVTLADNTEQSFGNVMGIKADAESYFLSVGYAIDEKVYEKVYQTGKWKRAIIDVTGEVDYHLPAKPV